MNLINNYWVWFENCVRIEKKGFCPKYFVLELKYLVLEPKYFVLELKIIEIKS